MLRPDEVESATGVELPEHEDYDTVAGLIMQRLGRMAALGDAVVVPLPQHADDEGDPLPPQVAELRVERLDGLRIDRVSVRTRAATAGDRGGVDGR
jgi:CBS domain containing-hemolysin-like protein